MVFFFFLNIITKELHHRI